MVKKYISEILTVLSVTVLVFGILAPIHTVLMVKLAISPVVTFPVLLLRFA